jgi:hypothetical protein
LTYIQSFMKIGLGIQKLLVGDIEIARWSNFLL